jgi:hypothetical protein
MAKSFFDQIVENAEKAVELYHRLIFVVAPSGQGKTAALQEVRLQKNVPLVNVNLELSLQMLDLTKRQRVLKLPSLLLEIINKYEGDIILLDNIEVLFDVTLKQDPMRLLLGLSRNKTLVVAWNGIIKDDYIIYATPNHPEYKRYPLNDFLIVSPDTAE